MGTKLTPKRRAAFLAALAETGNVTESARAAGVARPHVYEWKRDDSSFAAAWDDALEQAADVMEREALRRAVEGTRRLKFDRSGKPILIPVFGPDGRPVYRVDSDGNTTDQLEMAPYIENEYSDTLLIFLLKGARPEKYRERNEITGSGGGPIVIRQFTDALNTAYADDTDNPAKETE